mgnify:CR=1 FL=1
MDALVALAVVVVLVVAARLLYARHIERMAEEQRRLAEEQRRAALIGKYGDVELVDAIVAGRIWQGMSEEQLLESWGSPVDISERVFKTKVARTFKYNQTGKNQFADRVMVENGFVVGWHQR